MWYSILHIHFKCLVTLYCNHFCDKHNRLVQMLYIPALKIYRQQEAKGQSATNVPVGLAVLTDGPRQCFPKILFVTVVLWAGNLNLWKNTFKWLLLVRVFGGKCTDWASKYDITNRVKVSAETRSCENMPWTWQKLFLFFSIFVSTFFGLYHQAWTIYRGNPVH